MRKITFLIFLSLISMCSFAQLPDAPEDFEGTFPPAGWNVYDNGFGTLKDWVQTPGGTAEPFPAYEGTYSAMVDRENVPDTDPTPQDWLVTPLVTLPDNPQLLFYSRLGVNGDQGGLYRIMVSTDPDPSNLAAYTQITQWTETQINPVQQEYTEKTVQLTGLGGQSVYLAFVMIGDDDDRWLIDYVRIVEECLPPTALTVANIGLDSAELNWTSPTGVTSWEIEVIEAALPSTGIGEVYSDLLPYTAENLDPDTNYKFYVRSVCGVGNYSAWAGPLNFSTAALGETCGAPIEITTLPYSTTDNTSNYGDDYSGSPGASGCGTTNNYLNGDDVVYAYTATADGVISINMTGTGNAAGIFVYDDCADIGVNCLAGGVGNATTPVSLPTVSVLSGTTYYIVISTWATPQSTPYTLTVQVVNCPPPTNLSATNIDNDSADLSWNANGSTEWEIVVQPVGTGIPAGSGTGITVNSNYNVTATTGGTPFTEATTYEYYVRGDCGNGTFSAWAGPYIFMTTQLPAAMDFTDGFEAASGWSLSNGTAPNQWVIGNAVNNGGSNSLYITNDAGVSNSFTNTVTSVVHAYRDIQMPATVDQLLLSYDWRAVGESCCDYLRVWVVPATFVPTAGTQITAAASGGTQFGGNQNMNSNFLTANYVVNATAYSGQVMRLIFEWRNDGSIGANPPAAVDNVNLSVITCPAPTNLVLNDLQIDQATISWTGPSSVSPTFDYYLSTTNTPPTDATVPTDNVPGTTAVLDPLDDSTGYFVWVRSNCGTDDYSFWVGPLAFNTPQVPADLNFFDDFEDGTVEWTLNNGTQTNKWIVGTATSNGTGSSLYITNDNGVSNAFTNNSTSVVHAYRDLQMPATAVSEISVSFDWKAVGESCCDYLRVWMVPITFTPTPGTMITGASGGTQISPGNLNMNANWTTANYVVDASGYAPGQIVRLIFEWRNDGSVGTNPPAAVDNVNVSVITCPAPDGLAVSNVTEDSATVSWNPPADLPDSYDYYLSTSNTSPAPDAVVTDNVDPTTVDLDGLTPSTTYYIWVRSNCGTDDYSFWVGPLVFNTTQIPADTNFYDDFEGPVEWTLNNGTQPNQWVVGTAVSNSPTSSLYISNDSGTSNAYTNNSSSTVHAYRDIAIPATGVGEAILQFDWLAMGESCCDYLKAWIVPVTYTPTPGTMITTTNSGGIQYGGNFNQSSSWTTETYIFDASPYQGQTLRLVFEWRNDGSVGTNPPAAVDNVILQILTCPAPVDLLSSGMQGTSFVELSWTPVGSETQWEVVVQPMGTGNPGQTPAESVIVTDNPTYTLDIEEGEYYEYYVRAICSESDISLWAGPLVFSIFNPPGCANVEVFDPELEILLPNSEIVICPEEDNCIPLTANYLQTGETSSYEIESIDYAPPFPFTGGTPVSVGTDDVWSPLVQLPFDFCFFGEIYSEVLVGSNGVVTFNTGNPSGYCPWSFNQTIPNTGFPILNAIYGVYQDIDPSINNDNVDPDINFQVLGNYPCRALVVNFSEVAQFSGACNNDPAIGGQTTQIVLYEISNVIEIYIGNRIPCTSWQNGAGVVGLQNAGGTVAFVPDGRNTGPWTATEEAWRFTPNGTSNVVFEWLQDGVSYSDQEEITVCVTEPTTMTARATYTNCNGELLVRDTSVLLRLAEEIEEQDPNDLAVCNTTGSATFNLPDSMVDIIAGLENPENFTFTYYLTEAAANLGGEDNLPDSYTTTTNQTIYVRVQENGSDCFTVWSFDLIIENNPPQFTLDGDFDVCEGETVTVTVTPINFDLTEATYSWTFEGAALPDTGSTITATESGIYEVVIDRNGCTASEAVQVTITPLPVADVMTDVTSCDSYVLPELSAGNNYYTGPAGSGDMLTAGTELTSGQMVYIYAQVEGTDCSDESSFTITVVPTPVLGITGGCEGGLYILEVSLDDNYTENTVTIEWTGPNGSTIGTGLTVTAEEIGDYMVTVTPLGGDICSSVLVQSVESIACLIPRGISPNEDGMNDNFDLRGFGVTKLSIFNRYGKEVYSKTDYTNEWYGLDEHGKELPTGTYFYSLELNDGTSKTGWVYINRED
ncbi:T9SS type B sorting domain-containing protein [Flavobacterium alkalisoli]|uniref:T9SS type B sorting domain-containing protein n=1 Tax=Flavobacterium alkalisoli TaxID=2602769 RepID=A0A5B9FWA4_9FLAO|nr:fibronectin type III domain-containing protein [Flavobacterium alkalisoli]QEE50471.1 T9SS type B sorting domain-containing protein [Flavobacterium alkalisoli]